TVMSPSGKVAGASLVTPGTPQLSLVVGAPRLTPLAEHLPESVFTVTVAGPVIAGFSVSLTVTVKLVVAALPAASVALQSTVVVPTGKVCGEVIVVAPTLQTTVGVPQLSVALAEKLTEAEHCPASVFAFR